MIGSFISLNLSVRCTGFFAKYSEEFVISTVLNVLTNKPSAGITGGVGGGANTGHTDNIVIKNNTILLFKKLFY